MTPKTLCLVAVFLANACPARPDVQLTREIRLTPADLCLPKPTPFEDFVGRLADSHLVENLVDTFLASQADTVIALQQKIASNSEDLVGILEVLNEGAGAEVLRVEDGFVGVDPGELERFAVDTARTLSRALFPGDPFRQIIFFSTARVQIRGVAVSIAPQVLSIRVPLKALAAVLPPLPPRAISKRDVGDGLAELLWSVVQTTVCQTVRPVVSIVNGTILGWEDFLGHLTVETEADNPLSVFLAGLVKSVIAATRELFANVRGAVGILADTVCGAGSARRRRDVATDVDVVADGSALQQRSVTIFTIIGGVLAFVWTTLLAPVVNVAAKAFVARAVSFLTSAIDTFLNTTFVDAANTVIDIVTNQL